MASKVYSKQLIGLASVVSGPVNVYVVPAGYVTVVKFIAITYGLNVTPGWAAVLETTTGAKLFSAGAGVADVPTHDFTTTAEFGSWTLEFPQGLSVETGPSLGPWTVDIWASGYELELP